MKKLFLLIAIAAITISCYDQERNCTDFKTGKFQFNFEIDGQKKTTLFQRTTTMEIDYFEGKSDTSSVRWINECEYILQKINPKNRAEQKAIQIKIVTTKQNSYTFEFSNIGDHKKQKGTVIKIN